ncbi:MAG: hypothetical protein SPD80_04050 [Atopobium sp.]|uniref:hypothetical protein n=1 Tax=Atopobium sp. TaxID=1872650 RepID=UPI002A81F4F5|nr:hypothetical protein [Atopobium sp.]MDY4522745.1 hypothetical protein [Atopobium sp.]
MANSLPDQRKEIAEKLRETKEECNQRDYPWMVEDLMRALGFLSYEDADDQIFDRLAELIDPTCHDFGVHGRYQWRRLRICLFCMRLLLIYQ